MMDAELDKEQAELAGLMVQFCKRGNRCEAHQGLSNYPRSAAVAGHDSRAVRISDTLVADRCAVCGEGYHRHPRPGEDVREEKDD